MTQLTPLNVLLLAEESAGLELLRRLHATTPHSITVMCSTTRKSRLGSNVSSLAGQLGLPCWPARDIKDPMFPHRLRQQQFDLLVSVRSRYIVPQAVIDAPRIGAFNLHTGPLPQYAGINVINWAIYNGELRHAVTVHHLTNRIDGGSIAYQTEFPIEPTESAAQLTRKCFKHAMPLLIELIDTAARDPLQIPAIEQDPDARIWHGPEIPNNGYIAWQDGAQRVFDFIRACDYFPLPSPWGRAKTRHHGRDIAVLKTESTGVPADQPPGHVGASREGGVMVSAGDRWLLLKELLLDDTPVAASHLLSPGDRLLSGPE